MNESFVIMLPILIPILAGTVLLFLPERMNRQLLTGYVGAALLVTGGLAVYIIAGGAPGGFTLFKLTQEMPVYFKADALGKFFAAIVTLVWILGGVFSFEYMKHEQNEKRYFGFYLIVFGVLYGLDFSGNLITMYAFYEFMTLTSMPLVFHALSKEAIMAGLKYAFYSFCGAYMALFGVYFLFRYGNGLEFVPGGVLNAALVPGHEGILLIAAFFMLIGFGVKAGMFPLHAWLSTAHPVAPAPASAVLSGIIVKAGVLASIRTVFYLFGTDFLRGTWVQYAWLSLSLFTVFMGSMLAYKEKRLKKRLAYSTVSKISYILFGLALMNPVGLTGSLLHVAFHAVIKSALFLAAGAVIFKTGRTNVDELQGIGKAMAATLVCFGVVSLGLVGIPPMSGFVSKWYLAVGSLDASIPVFSWLGPAVLLLSALLTAGYLLPVVIRGFLPGRDYGGPFLKRDEASLTMVVPMLILAALTVVFGMFPGPLLNWIAGITGQFM